MRCRSNLFVVAGPFCKFGPAGTDQGLRVRRGHLDRAIPADIDDPTRPGLYLPRYAGGRSQADPKALGVLIALAVAALLRLLSHQFDEPLVRERALEPVEELRRRVDLVIVLAPGGRPSSRAGTRRATAPSREYGQSPSRSARFARARA